MRDISNPHLVQQWYGQFNEQGFKWIIGKGEKIFFWEDIWIGDQALSEKFPRIYSISRWKHCKVNLVLDNWAENLSMRWTRSLRI